MIIQKNIMFALLLVFFSGIANAGLLELEPGWPRLVDNNSKIKSQYKGNTAFFEVENKKSERGHA